MYYEAACVGWYEARENSIMSYVGISSVVLVTGAIDGSATLGGAGKVSLFSDFTRDKPMADLTRYL